jgi:hypothetical protein
MIRALSLWRTKSFRTPRPCVCGDEFTRSHVTHLIDELGLHAPDRRLDAIETHALIARSFKAAFADDWNPDEDGWTNVVDFLLGHQDREYAEIGLATISRWHEPLEELIMR